MTEAILEVQNLTKNFGSFRAVDSISFAVPKGKIIGLLGPNGAGKTTTIHMLLGITLPDSGSIRYFGKEFYANRAYCLSRINFASTFNKLLNRITVWENLEVFAMLYSVADYRRRIVELADYFEVRNLLSEKFMNLSTGQKTRVILVKSLLNDPEIILMDEPTAALDPDISDKVLTLVEQLRSDRNLSILYTSHDMDEVSRICDEVLFLSKGKLVAHDTPLALTKRVTHTELTVTFDAQKEKVAQFLNNKNLSFQFLANHIVKITVSEKEIPTTIFALGDAGIWITDIEVKKPNLEDVFLQFVREKPYVA